jgi:hypothetical protein
MRAEMRRHFENMLEIGATPLLTMMPNAKCVTQMNLKLDLDLHAETVGPDAPEYFLWGKGLTGKGEFDVDAQHASRGAMRVMGMPTEATFRLTGAVDVSHRNWQAGVAVGWEGGTNKGKGQINIALTITGMNLINVQPTPVDFTLHIPRTQIFPCYRQFGE